MKLNVSLYFIWATQKYISQISYVLRAFYLFLRILFNFDARREKVCIANKKKTNKKKPTALLQFQQ